MEKLLLFLLATLGLVQSRMWLTDDSYTKTSKDVSFSPCMKFISFPFLEQFLINGKNMQAIIVLIVDLLKTQRCTHSADGDADVEIVHAAVSSSECVHTTVIGKDTDLMILHLMQRIIGSICTIVVTYDMDQFQMHCMITSTCNLY